MQVSNVSGTSVVNGVSVTVTSSGGVGSGSTCTAPVHYFNFAGGSYTFTFSSPVSSVRLPYINNNGGTLTTTHFTVNGSSYTLTGANITGADNQCSDATVNVISAGDLTNTGDVSGFPNSQIDIPGPITSITVQQVGGSNISAFQMFFSGPVTVNGSSQSFTVCNDGSAVPINSLLSVNDGTGMTETWTVTSNPTHVLSPVFQLRLLQVQAYRLQELPIHQVQVIAEQMRLPYKFQMVLIPLLQPLM